MSARISPCRKKTRDILEDLLEGYHEVALVGPHCAVRYLETFFRESKSSPKAVRFFAYELMAESAYASDDLDRCISAVEKALEYLPDAREALAREVEEQLPGMTFLERGISAKAELGDARGARAWCDTALELGMGKHFEKKKASLNWDGVDGD